MTARALLVLLVGVGAAAQVPLAPAPSVDQVLGFLQGMAISPELKAAVAPVLGAGMTTGRAGTRVALEFLGRLALLPRAQAEEALLLVHRALERGFIVDGLMNEVLKVLQMGQPWEAVMTTLRVRFNLLLATQQVLLTHRVIGPGSQAPGGPLLEQDRLVVETAWAVGDWILGQPRDTLESYVRSRLVRLRGSVLSPGVVDPLLAALTPELLGQIASRAYGP
ncbi:MAG: hypothetical protein N2320_01295 [Candidatus Bipolaricaulota bacterium]|nr:hypothetical protein [Candidatus Bipolaricaulota bacterium]